MKLGELASLLRGARTVGDQEVAVRGIKFHSQRVEPGDLFVCVPSVPNLLFIDRHHYAGDAIERGASALVVGRLLDVNVPQIVVRDVRYAMAVMANHFYGYPSRAFRVIGVTGTNGKTTTAHIVEHLLHAHGKRTGLMGNLGLKVGAETIPYDGNTPESPELQRSFLHLKERGAEYCVMETSSHGLQLGRVLGTRFRTGIFTNLTQDHLDFHLTMDRYREAKGLLFSRMGNGFERDEADRQYAVLNADDPASDYFAALTPAQVVTYGLEHPADVCASEVRLTAAGTTFRLSAFAETCEAKLPLIGKFNVSNALGALAAVLLEGVPLESAAAALTSMPVVEGRMEPVDAGQPFLVLVDYAHTPDGLEKALATISEFAEGRIITVFGCGGDRDRTKRPVMGAVAAAYSDCIIVTSDNPRTEDPDAILRDIEPGITGAGFHQGRCLLLADRRAAIKKAVEMAGPGDVVLIAGKGHETYQIVNGATLHFDDREEARAAIRGL